MQGNKNIFYKKVLTMHTLYVTLPSMIHIHKCLRCGNEWASRNEHPLRCSHCKTPYWHIPRKAKGSAHAEPNNKKRREQVADPNA